MWNCVAVKQFCHVLIKFSDHLPAKIQALKKSATKGDKKKKKEVQEEIANLEADLDRRHKEEEENLSTNVHAVSCSSLSLLFFCEVFHNW